MWPTTSVAVRLRDWTARDSLGNRVEAYHAPTYVDVLVAPSQTTDLDGSRPDGIRADLTLHFPKSYQNPSALRGALVTLPAPWAGDYRVIGIPQPYDPRLVPGELWAPVDVEAWDG